MSSNCSSLEGVADALNASLATLQASYDACGCGQDPCANVPVEFDKALHIGGIFVLLGASFVGVAVPLVGKRCQALQVPPFVLVVGKCVGMGVVLAVALIHMLIPSNESFTSPCVPVAFNQTYTAYAYLFALLAALLMQFVDVMVERVLSGRMGVVAEEGRVCDGVDGSAVEGGVVAGGVVSAAEGGVVGLVSSDLGSEQRGGRSGNTLSAVDVDTGASPSTKEHHGVEEESFPHHYHSHTLPKDFPGQSVVQRLVAAALMELGVTAHSVFIGLAVGVVPDAEMKVLLIALSFHQAFEGVALGSKLAETTFREATEVIFAAVFALAAPVGMAIGVSLMLTSGMNVNGESFLLLQGVFEGICAGILLYLGFGMLFNDFAVDMQRHCGAQGVSHPDIRRFAMFAGLWTGAGVMAYIGKYI